MAQELYKLPEGWEWRPLGEVASLINGRAYKKHELLNAGPVPVLRVGNFFSNRSWYYSDLELPQQKYCDEGDLLYAWSASFGPKIWEGPRAIFHYHIWKIITSNFIDKHYLYWLLELDSVDIKSQGNGVGMKHATKGGMEKRQIPLPPLNEQKRIVAKLDALFTRIDTAITHLQQTLELSKSLFASVLDEMFSPETNKYKVVSLNQVATVARGKSKHRPRNDKTLFGGNYPFIQTGDVRNAEKYITTYSKAYSEKGLAQSKLWAKGTICLTIAANIGEVAMLGIDACFPDSVVGISSDSESNEYIYYFLTTLQRHLDSKATMAAQKNINLRILSDIEIPLPPLDGQKRIVAHLDALSERTYILEASTQEKINDLTALKASLLDAAFKGQL